MFAICELVLACVEEVLVNTMSYRNALLALTKMLRALMNIFAHHALLIFFPIELISYMCEVILFSTIGLWQRNSLSLSLSHQLLFWWCTFSGGVSQPACPYKCISDKYRMPSCYTPLEELIYTFGGIWPFALLLSCILVLLSLLLNTLRIKVVGSSSYHRENSIDHHSHHHFPYLLSLSEVRWSS